MDPAEQRANAVAKLRRAASLPRMKDGRRPPMHGDAGGVSEGERSQGENGEEKKEEGHDRTAGAKSEAEVKAATQAAPTHAEKTESKKEPEEARQEEPQETSEPDRPTTPAQHAKRRSRSRSRSRGSKDLRAKMRQLDVSMQASGASDGPDEPVSLDSPPLTSPQAYFLQLQMAQPLVSPLSPFAHISPAPPSASVMPSLQALQSRHLQGLFRSNSAAARMMAMHKLTGGAEPLDFGAGPSYTQQTPSPGRARLTRNNTVAGEERVAARQQLLRRLNERIQDKSDVETTSGNEDAFVTTPKSRRRRSRRKSGTSAVVDDREFLGATAASTPAATPVPTSHDQAPPLIALPPSRTPSRSPGIPLEIQATPDHSPHRTSDPRTRSPTPLATTASNHYQYDSPITHRGLIVEEEDDDPVPTPPRAAPRSGLMSGSSSTGPSTPMRVPRGLDAPSISSSSGEPGARVPVMLADVTQHSPFRQDVFPKSPFGTPIKERARDEEGDEEHVLFGAARTALTTASDREISWIAEPVPSLSARRVLEQNDREISWTAESVPLTSIAERDVSWVESSTLDDRMPVYDEDEDDETDEEAKKASAAEARSHQPSPRESGESQELLIDLEATPETINTPSDYSAVSASQHSAASTATVNTNARESNISDLSGASANRGDTSSQLLDRTHSQADSMQGWPEFHGTIEAPVLTSKRSADSSNTSAWSKMKSTFTRSGSSLGRRSRTNSIATREKRENTESSRESAASLASGRRESKGDAQAAPTWPQSQTPLTPSPSTSTPMLLAPPPRSGVSPIPPPSDTDAAKYINPKLFPFPGMVKLQEETLRNRAMGISASSPDIVMQPSSSGDGAMLSANSSVSSQQQDNNRERKLSHQISDSRLLPKYQLTPGPAISGAPSSIEAQIDYFNIPQQPAHSNTLPFTREGVKKWLSARLFPSISQQGGPSTSPLFEQKARAETTKKPSLSDLLGRKDLENVSDWDDIDKPRAPTSTSTSTVVAKSQSKDTSDNSRDGEIQESSPDDPVLAYQYSVPVPQPPQGITTIDTDPYDTHESRHLSVPLSSSHDPSSATPDPASSEESPSQSSQRSESPMDSIYSPEESSVSAQAADILQRLDEVLHAEYHNRLWGTALTAPSRRLMLSSPMLQVANCNTVKDRFLFLFTDILVIAKPMLPDRDSLLDTQKIYPPDRKFFIKNVVHLKDIRLNVDRDEDVNRPTSALVSQRPEFLRNFVHEFAENSDVAVALIIDVRDSKGCVTLGQLLVQLPEIDRARLGEYLSRRTSKSILKAYLDAFGFVGINLDTSLRIFLLSIHIPTGPGHANTLETLLDTFAARWYEANAGIVAFDRDLAVRLVRAIVRLNEALHAAIALDPGSANYSRPYITSRDFTEAFRRHDPRGLVPDGTLERIYTSVRQEKLCQARNPTNGRAPNPVSLKRPVPSRITYRRQSEPIVVRIPQADPQLTIQLFGQDLTFDPPVLTFAKSNEASFRVMGNAFGPKTMIMACSGSNAPNYSGLPLSTIINVERAFMRNTFQIAFATPAGLKRKYMFSVDDPVIRHEWTGSLKRQIETTRASQNTAPELPGNVQTQVYRAAETLSFQVLQDTLLAAEPEPGSLNGTLRHTAARSRSMRDSVKYGSGLREGDRRSQSRSQMYRLGAGRHEYEQSGGNTNSTATGERPTSGLELLEALRSPEPGARLWTGAELELLCAQNSAIALVLALLQAALPYDADEEPGVNMSASIFQFPVPPVQRGPSQSSAYQI